jgi:hypothetical protein
MPPKPVTTPGNAINMLDVSTKTDSGGFVTITYPTKCSTKVPELVYARAVLTAPAGALPAGTILKTLAPAPTMDDCKIQFVGPANEALNAASVLVFFAAFENAK